MGLASPEHLLEREEELAALDAVIERARRGEGRLVLFEGPAGIGKTRLLRAARDGAQDAGMRVLTARGAELERDYPFALVRQLFELALHEADRDERDELLAGAAAPASPVVGIETGTAGGLADPSFATLNALYWLTSNLAEATPTLLAVDDAHWADKPSLRFISFLLPRLADLPVLLAVAARPSEPGADQALLDQLTVDPNVHVLRPRALSPSAVAQLVRSRLSNDAEDEFCAASHDATGGNPFLLRELLVELSAQRSTGTAGEASGLRDLAPATIRRSVLLRIARLPEGAGRLARAVAICGDSAEPRHAGALAELDPRETAAAADALVASGILEPGRPLRFAHPLVRNAVYSDLPGADKAMGHRAHARLLEADGAEPERIAVHLLATDPDGDPEIVATLTAAARRALDRAAPEAAIAYSRRALVEPPDPVARRELLWHLVRGSFRAADRAALEGLSVDVLDELSGDRERLLASAHELFHWLAGQGRVQDADRLLQRAKEAALDAGDYDLVMRFESLDITSSPFEESPSWEGHRDRIAPDTPAQRLLFALEAVRSAFQGASAATVADLGRQAFREGLIFREQPPLTIHGQLITIVRRTDALEETERALEQYAIAARAAGSTPRIASALALRGELAMARGAVAEAHADVQTAVVMLRHAGLLQTWNWLALLIEVLTARGELDAAERELEAEDLTTGIPESVWAPSLLHARACLRLEQGRIAEALEDLETIDAVFGGARVKNIALLPSAAVGAIALTHFGEDGSEDRAREVAGRYLHDAREWGTPRAIGIGLHATGVVRGGDEGIELLREAAATLERSPARLEHAKALTDLGAALRRANRRAEAREPLRAALEMSRRGGALAVARRAHEELQATGQRLPRFAQVGHRIADPFGAPHRHPGRRWA